MSYCYFFNILNFVIILAWLQAIHQLPGSSKPVRTWPSGSNGPSCGPSCGPSHCGANGRGTAQQRGQRRQRTLSQLGCCHENWFNFTWI